MGTTLYGIRGPLPLRAEDSEPGLPKGKAVEKLHWHAAMRVIVAEIENRILNEYNESQGLNRVDRHEDCVGLWHRMRCYLALRSAMLGSLAMRWTCVCF